MYLFCDPVRRVLYVCSTFPPRLGGSIPRNVGITRHLPTFGWSPTVITTRSPRVTITADAPAIGPVADVIRAWTPRYPGGGSARKTGGVRFHRTSRLRSFALTWLLIPDPDAPWAVAAFIAGLRQLRARRFDAIVSSGPPHSAHLAARLLAPAVRVWIADCTDPWSEHLYAYWRGSGRRSVERVLERAVLGRADVVVTPTESLGRAYRDSVAKRVAVVPNGYAEDDFDDDSSPSGDVVDIAHVGSFYGPRSPGNFIKALVAYSARSERPLQIRVAGYADGPSMDLLTSASSRLPARVNISYTAEVSRDAAIRLMRSARILLLVTDAGAGGRDLIPIKTYEYLRAGRPILALVPRGETQRLLASTGGARIVDPDDVPSITAALHELLDEARGPQPAPRPLIERFEWRSLTAQLAGLLDGLVSGTG